MSQGSETAGTEMVAAEGGADRLSALPDDLLRYLLSFLPSRCAVQTSVLARRWRDQWKSVPAIRITRHEAKACWGPSALNSFVNNLLQLRDKLPLHEAELNSFDGEEDFDEGVQYLEEWVRYCISWKAQKMSVSSNDEQERWLLPQGVFASQHLRVLELNRVESNHGLDLSSCMHLEDLEMEHCTIFGDRVMSQSLKRLSIRICTFASNVRVQISAPNLISFQLSDCDGKTPLLDSMLLLQKGFVRLALCEDYCQNNYEFGDSGSGSCVGCRGSSSGKSTCVLFEGLSASTHLELIARAEMFIFRKDLKRCPVFSKLKTLSLNEWCLTTNFGALVCILQHSPVLEKLTLEVVQFMRICGTRKQVIT